MAKTTAKQRKQSKKKYPMMQVTIKTVYEIPYTAFFSEETEKELDEYNPELAKRFKAATTKKAREELALEQIFEYDYCGRGSDPIATLDEWTMDLRPEDWEIEVTEK